MKEEKYMKIDTEINEMINGNRESILKGLKSNAVGEKTFAIIKGTQFYGTDKEILEGIRMLEHDSTPIFGRLVDETIGALASAALDIASVKEYMGDNPYTKKMIESKFEGL